MEKLSYPIGVLWELYRSPLGSLSSFIRFLCDLNHVLQDLYGKIMMSYRDTMGTLFCSIRFLCYLYLVLHCHYGKGILSYRGPMGTLYESYGKPILLYKVPVLSSSCPARSLLKSYHVI